MDKEKRWVTRQKVRKHWNPPPHPTLSHQRLCRKPISGPDTYNRLVGGKTTPIKKAILDTSPFPELVQIRSK